MLHSQTGIEEEDTLSCPTNQITVVWSSESFDILGEFLVHVTKTGRDGDMQLDTEA